MRQEINKSIAAIASKNSDQSFSDMQETIALTEQNLGAELTGWAVLDRPYRQFYTDKMWNVSFPHEKISDYVIQESQGMNEKVAYHCGKDFTYGELHDLILKYAYLLRKKHGIRSGEVVVVDVLSTPYAIATFFALNYIGAIMRPVDPISSPDQVKAIVRQMNAKCFICHDLLADKLKDVFAELQLEVGILPVDRFIPGMNFMKKAALSAVEWRFYHANRKNPHYFWLATEAKLLDIKEINIHEINAPYQKDQVALIIPTSGTTGEAKGVQLTNENILCNVFKEGISGWDVNDQEVCFNPLPTCSSFLWYVLVLILHFHATTSLIPNFELNGCAELIANDPCTCVIVGPVIINEICNFLEAYPDSATAKALRRKKHYISAGDLLDTDLYQRAKHLGIEIHDNLGTSENGGPSTNPNGIMNNRGAFGEGSVGVVLPGNDVGIFAFDFENSLPLLDAEKYENGLLYYEIGEICFKRSNPNVFKGYYQNSAANESVFLTHQDGTEWYHTGDLGYLDPAGRLYCRGRKSGLIVRQGHKVWTPKIENIVLSIQGVTDCAVVGIPDEQEKEVPVCFIAVEPGVQDSGIDTMKHTLCKEVENRLDALHVPVKILVLEKIPKNLMGKNLVGELKRMAQE